MLLDQIYPGQVPLQKDSFTRLKVDRHIDVDRLKEGKYMDNLEFMQWFKRFYEISTGRSERAEDYDAVDARCRGKGGKTFVGSKKAAAAPRVAAAPGSPGAGARMSSNAAIVANKALVAEVQTLKAEKVEMKGDMIGLEKERDFYFDKLRDIEILLQDMEEEGLFKGGGDIGNEISTKVFKILYATADGFVQSPSAQSQQSAKSGMVTSSPLMAGVGQSQSQSFVGEDEENAPISPVKYPVSASIELDTGAEGKDDDSTGAGVPAPPDEEEEEDL
eukprot:GSChrysophyteH2.ASY1.ANO1.138.1 assembled CDS